MQGHEILGLFTALPASSCTNRTPTCRCSTHHLTPTPPHTPQPHQDALFSRSIFIRSAAETLLGKSQRADYDAWLQQLQHHAAPGPPLHAVSLHDLPGALSLLQEAGEWAAVIQLADQLLDDGGHADNGGSSGGGIAALFGGKSAAKYSLTAIERSDIAVAAGLAALAAATEVINGGAGSATAARRVLLHALRRLRGTAGGAGGAQEALALQLCQLSAELAVVVVEEQLAAPRARAVAAAAAAAEGRGDALAADRADALSCLSGLLFGLGEHQQLEGRARERVLRLVRGNLTAAEQVGSACANCALHFACRHLMHSLYLATVPCTVYGRRLPLGRTDL